MTAIVIVTVNVIVAATAIGTEGTDIGAENGSRRIEMEMEM